MVEIRWHSRAGQGAVTGAKGLGTVVAATGKEVQAYALYGSAKRGAAMNAYNRIDDKPIINHATKMNPDYVLVIDPGLAYTDDITKNDKPTTQYIITTHLPKEGSSPRSRHCRTRPTVYMCSMPLRSPRRPSADPCPIPRCWVP